MSRLRPKRPFRKVPEFLSLPPDKVPLSQGSAGSHPSNRGRNSRTRGKSPSPRDGSGGNVHRINRGSPLPPDSPGDAPLPLPSRTQADSIDMRREIDNLVEHVRAVAMDKTPSTSTGGHFDWAGDEDDSLPDLDDWLVTTASAGPKDGEPRIGEGSKPLQDAVEDAPLSPVISKSVDLHDVAPPITMTVDSSLDSNDPFSDQSIVPKVSLPARHHVPTRARDNLLKHSHPLRQIDPTTIPLLEHDPLKLTPFLDKAPYSVQLPTSQRRQPSHSFPLSKEHTAVSPPLLRFKGPGEILTGDGITGENIDAAFEASNGISTQPTPIDKGNQRTQQYLTPGLESTGSIDLEKFIHFHETRSTLQPTSEFDRSSASQTPPPRSPRRHNDQHLLPPSAIFPPERISRSRSPTPHRTLSPLYGGRHVRTHSSPQPGMSLPHRAPNAHRPVITGDAISRLASVINSASSKPQASTATMR